MLESEDTVLSRLLKQLRNSVSDVKFVFDNVGLSGMIEWL